MSTEPYPEVNVDESGIVPAQASRAPEWPKKIRTLTATELDRLTIDDTGRFYWDGKLVNYESRDHKSASDKSSDSAHSSTDVSDRDPYSFDDSKSHEQGEGDEHERSDDTHSHAVAHRDDRFADLDDVRVVPHRAVHHHGDTAAEMSDAYAAPGVQIPDRIRVSMTRWQKLGVLLVVLCFMIGALGVAAFGFIAVHDWGCRSGFIDSHCATVPGARPRSDIPA